MPKAEDPRLRIPTPYERNVGIPSFRKPIVLIKSIKGDAKYVKTSQSDPNTSAPDPPTKLFVNSQLRPWNHAAELDYSQPKDWDEQRIISYIFQNGFSIPARDPSCPWVTITGRDGVTTMLPRGYRTPLLFTAKFQWESLRLIMASTSKTAEWEEYKYDILHVSRLCTRFLADARRAVGLTGMEKGWRSIMFDRALTRYYRCWLVNRPAFLRDFWYEFGEEQYERDVLKNDWTRFVLKGHKGFCITKEELQNGVSFGEFIKGLSFLREGTVAEVRDAFPAPTAPSRGSIPTRPSGSRDERTEVKVARFFQGIQDSRAPLTVEEFDLGRFGVHIPHLSSSQSTSRNDDVSQSFVSPSLQIKREIMDEVKVLLDYPMHSPIEGRSQISSGSFILRRAPEDVATTQTQNLSIHEYLHSRPPDFSFTIPRPHSSPSERSTTSPLVPETKNSTFGSAEKRRLSATALAPEATPPADVETGNHHIKLAFDQLNLVSNEPTSAALGAASCLEIITPPSSGDDQSQGPSSVYETKERNRQRPLLGIKPSGRESSINVERTFIPSTDAHRALSPPLADSSTETLTKSTEIPLDRAHKIEQMPMSNVDNSKSNSAPTSIATSTSSLANEDGVADGSDASGPSAVNAPNDVMRPEYNVPIEASRDRPSINANLDGLKSYLIRDSTYNLGPRAIDTHVIPATRHEKSASRGEAWTALEGLDSTFALNRVVSMFRDTLGGLDHILAGGEGEQTMTPQLSSQPLSPSVSSNSTSTQSEASLVDALLDQIKGLKREMKKEADDQLRRAVDVQRMHAEIYDMRRTIVFRDSLRQVSLSKCNSSSPTGRSLRKRTNPHRSQHPLAHLFAMESETTHSDPDSSSTNNKAEKQDAPSGLMPDAVEPWEYHYPPISPAGLPNHVPHDDVPLPVKSQRKRRRMLFLHHQQNLV